MPYGGIIGPLIGAPFILFGGIGGGIPDGTIGAAFSPLSGAGPPSPSEGCPPDLFPSEPPPSLQLATSTIRQQNLSLKQHNKS